MNPELPIHRHLIAAAGGTAAVWLGWTVANGEFFWPGLAFAFFVPMLAAYVSGIRADTLVAGAVLFGYLVGNRGFAQLSIPRLPLLPGEVALGLGLAVTIWQAARTKTRLIQHDALNFTLLLWIVTSSMHLPIDIRAHGFVALRDFALVYYGLFFFLSQEWARDERCRRFLTACLSVGLALTMPITTLFVTWPDLFSPLNIGGVPLIFVKGDVSAGFMAAAVFWFGADYSRTGRWWWLLLMAACGAGAVFSNSRAALVALALGGGWLVILRERRIVKSLVVIAAIGAFGLLLEGAWPRSPGKQSQAFRLYENVLTVADFSGTQTPTSADLGDKPDNNRFRLVWWAAVLEQTAAEGPWLGLGFGQNLADQFVRRYYSDSGDEFNTRSPHNFVVTVFARTGVVGLACFLAVLASILSGMWRASRVAPDSGAAAAWLAPLSIFVAACFGVVLEGPMGAVVFWTLLGMLNASARETAADLAAPAGLADSADSKLGPELAPPLHEPVSPSQVPHAP